MKNLKTFILEFVEDESGLTAVEYAIAGSLVVGGLVAAFTQLGTVTDEAIEDLCAAAKPGDSTVDCAATPAPPAAG